MEVLQDGDPNFRADNMFSQEDYNFIFKELSKDGIYEELLNDLSPTDSLSFFDKNISLDSISLPDTLSLPDIDDISIKMEPSSPGSSTQSSCSFPDPDLFLNDVSMVEQARAANDGAASGGEGSVPETPPDTPPNEAAYSTPPHHFLDSPAVTVTVTTEPTEMVTPTSMPFTPVSLTQPLVSTVISSATPGTTQNAVVDAGGTQTLMLTPEEFAQLTSRGVLTLKTSQVAPKPSPAVVPAATSLPVIRGARVPVVKTTIKTEPATAPKTPKVLLGNVNPFFQYADNKALKRQQRMIKNRESACLSRRKRKEYVQKLELQVRDLNNQNTRLKEENARLRQRVAQLEAECLEPKKVTTSGSIKKTTALLAVVFMLSLNIAPISVILSGGRLNSAARGVPVPLPQHRFGRSLLWSQSDMPAEDNSFGPDVPSDSDLSASASEFLDGLNSLNASSKCPTYINQTESRRLETELRGFMLRVETETLRRKQQQKLRSSRPLKQSSLKPKLWTWAYKTVYATDWHTHRGQNFLQLYKASHHDYKELYQAIDRKEDTFYFVSFSGDHVLLSAAPQNRTSRPKMSLVVPAMMLNDSVGHSKDRVALMQIDCEVTNTRMVYVKESVIPPHLREPSENRTQGATNAPATNTSPSSGNHVVNSSTLIKVPSRGPRRKTWKPSRGSGL